MNKEYDIIYILESIDNLLDVVDSLLVDADLDTYHSSYTTYSNAVEQARKPVSRLKYELREKLVAGV